MMLLIGMKMSLTKKPMKPMIAKPIDVACAIFENSANADAPGQQSDGSRAVRAEVRSRENRAIPTGDGRAPVRSGFVQRFTRRHESRTNCRAGERAHAQR